MSRWLLLCGLVLVGCGDTSGADEGTDTGGDTVALSCEQLGTCASGGTEDPVTMCGDGLDNDEDGRVDCDDSDCADLAYCGGDGSEQGCQDGVDNDGDGATDCGDSDCALREVCQGDPEVCINGVDDDLDGLTDCDDGACAGHAACAPPSQADSDGDGLRDTEEAALGTDPGDPDTDRDGRPDGVEVSNIAAPVDSDGDGRIDALESAVQDVDGDGYPDESDAVDLAEAGDDRDGDGLSNADDADDDGDGVCDPGVEAGTQGCSLGDGEADSCPLAAGRQGSTDGDAGLAPAWTGDPCDADIDGDGALNAVDPCPYDVDQQVDGDGDGFGDACDSAPGDPNVSVLASSVPEPCSVGASGEAVCDLSIEEVLYVIAASGGVAAIDANGDGLGHPSEDAFVELRNTADRDLVIGGLEVRDAAAVRHVIAAGTVLRRGQRLVVFGGGSPQPLPRGTITQVASTGGLALDADGDTVVVARPDGVELTSFSFGTEETVTAAANRSVTRYPESAGFLHAFREHPGWRFGGEKKQFISPGGPPDEH